MEFSTKAGTLQPQQAGAQLFVCTETAQLNHPTALALLSSLEEGQTFADTKIPTDNGLQAVAVVRLEKTDRAALNKAAAEAAKWVQNQETVNADIQAFDEAQAVAVAEAFAGQIDTPAHILGWSLGGLVALYLTALYPDKIQSLCLTASFARLTADTDYPEGLAQPALGKMVGAFQQDYAKHIKQFLQLQLLHTPNAAEIIGNILPDLSRHGAPPALQAALDAVNQADARPLLSSIQAPSLLVFGQKDAITPPRMGEYLNRHLADSELVLMEKAAHAPFLSHADEFAERYRGFVEKVV